VIASICLKIYLLKHGKDQYQTITTLSCNPFSLRTEQETINLYIHYRDVTGDMRYKQFNNKVVVRVDKGEELVESLMTVCKTLDIKLGSIIGIGATDVVTVGLFNTKTRTYQSKKFTGDHEIAPLVGNISRMDGEVYLHLHVTLCNAEHAALGGHLSSAVISATFEGVVDIIDGQVTRDHDELVGLNLLKL